MGSRSTDPKEDRLRRELRLPAKPDPATNVVAGEILDIETSGQRLMRLAGKPVGPFILVDGVAFYPRRNGQCPVYQKLTHTLALARALCR
jgi:hypothetical protein